MSEFQQILNSTNSTQISTKPYGFDKWSWQNQVRFCTVLPLTAIALMGNSLVICGKIKKGSTSNSDLMMSILAIFDLIKTFTFGQLFLSPNLEGYWPHGLLACEIIQRMLVACFGLTANYVVLLTYERYKIIVHPFKGGLSKCRFRLAVIAFFLVYVIVFAPPQRFWFKVERGCHSVDINKRKIGYFIFEITVMALWLLFSSIAMSVILRKCTRTLLRTDSFNQNQRRFKQNKACVNIMWSIYIAYITSLIPWVAQVILDTVNHDANVRFFHSPWSILMHFLIAGSFCNAPLTYILFSFEFRNEIKVLFSKKRRDKNSISSSNRGILPYNNQNI